MRKLVTTSSLIAAVVWSAACTVHQTDSPSLTGPSELATSVSITAIPDSITQDGSSQSAISVTVFDANGRPKSGVTLRMDMAIGATPQDFGTLSARTIVTGADGKAATVYTAPPPPPPGSGGAGTRVTIVATPTGSDFQAATAHGVDIRLVPPGVILPVVRFVPNFTVSPASPTQGQPATFDASSTTDPDNSIVSYAWNFGDGTSGSGRTTSHAFSQAGAYSVTLTVADALGRAASTTHVVTVGGGTLPTVDFTFSPTAPGVSQAITFVATAQSGVAGHSIVRYDWNFGSGTPQQGQVVTKSYDVAGTYNVTLTVTDDLGITKSTTKTVTVGSVSSGLFADFTQSPTDPKISLGTNTVFFDASPSNSPAGISSYAWDFGDGSSGSGKNVSHTFAVAASYVVRLTITDAAGHTATTTKTVTIAP